MDLTLLRTFLVVADHGSFTLAAERLGLTQPGVSRQIAKLEQELGATLIERQRGALRLTAAGERVREFAAEWTVRAEELRRSLQERQDALSGLLQISASTTPGEFLVPSLVARFVDRHRLVQPEITIRDSAFVIDDLLDRRVEVGFVGLRSSRPGLRYTQIAEDEVVLAVPRTHPFAIRSEVELAELEGQPFVEREGGSGTWGSLRRALERQGRQLPPHRSVMVVNSIPAMLSAIQQGHGLGFISSLALVDHAPGRIVAVRISGLDLRRPLYLAYEVRRSLSLIARSFIAFVKEAPTSVNGAAGSWGMA